MATVTANRIDEPLGSNGGGLLAKWILENNPNARVAIITDRDELDKQIGQVFSQVGETNSRTASGHDLMNQLSQAKPRLLSRSSTPKASGKTAPVC